MKGAQTATLLAGSRRCNLSLNIPDVVLDELFANAEKRIRQGISALRAEAKLLKELGANIDLPQIDVQDAANKYRAEIERMNGRYGVTRIPYPNLSMKDLVAASYAGKKPKDSGDGYKDFLVFQSCFRSYVAQMTMCTF